MRTWTRIFVMFALVVGLATSPVLAAPATDAPSWGERAMEGLTDWARSLIAEAFEAPMPPLDPVGSPDSTTTSSCPDGCGAGGGDQDDEASSSHDPNG